MTWREALKIALLDAHDGMMFIGNPADEDDILNVIAARLKAEGMFIGPLRSTAEMDLAARLEPQVACDTWIEMVAEWQRGEGV